MNREIKFRASSANTNKMISWSELGNSNSSLKDAFFLKYLTNPPKSVCTLMQYTGIKDKNGKEIYEGDIRREEIEYEEGDEITYFVCTWIKELAIFSWLTIAEYIEYSDSDPQAFDTIFETENPYSMDISEADRYIICGNIYEKSELLK